jgi:hypothetical protein
MHNRRLQLKIFIPLVNKKMAKGYAQRDHGKSPGAEILLFPLLGETLHPQR